jgi:hypothetical protein
MLLANTFLRFSAKSDDILMNFLDTPEAPLSIHAFCEQGRTTMSKEPGDWYGVNSIAQVITNMFESPKNPDEGVFSQLSVLNFSEGQLYMDEILDKIRQGF